MKIIQYRPSSSNTDRPHPIQTNLIKYRPTSSNTDQPHPIQTDLIQYRPSSSNTDHPHPIQAVLIQYRPTSSNTDPLLDEILLNETQAPTVHHLWGWAISKINFSVSKLFWDKNKILSERKWNFIENK